jgi:hypothetical protein
MHTYGVNLYIASYRFMCTIAATQQIAVQRERVSSDTRDDTAVMNSKAATNTNDTDGSSTTASASNSIEAAAPTIAATAPVQQHVSDLSTMRSALAASKSSRVRVAQYTLRCRIVILY